MSLKDGYGFIQCAERDARMFFHYSEILDPSVKTEVQDEVEFTVMQVQILFFSYLFYSLVCCTDHCLLGECPTFIFCDLQ